MSITLEQIQTLEELQAQIKQMKEEIQQVRDAIMTRTESVQSLSTALYQQIFNAALNSRTQKLQSEENELLKQWESDNAQELFQLCKEAFRDLLMSPNALQSIIDACKAKYDITSCDVTISPDLENKISLAHYQIDPALPDTSLILHTDSHITINLSWHVLAREIISSLLEQTLSLELTIS